MSLLHSDKDNYSASGKAMKISADGQVAVEQKIKKLKGCGNTSWRSTSDGKFDFSYHALPFVNNELQLNAQIDATVENSRIN